MQLDEGDYSRNQPTLPYVPHTQRLLVPINAVQATLHLMQKVGNVESCVFWYGIRSDEGDLVASVRAPAQQMRARNYHVSPSAVSAMLGDMPEHWRPLAQTHCHPGINVEHSAYDEVMVASKKSLSLVFPFYGRVNRPWPTGIGIHEWQAGFWHMLSPGHAADRVAMTEAAKIEIRDFRP